jgi:hypothetical protein
MGPMPLWRMVLGCGPGGCAEEEEEELAPEVPKPASPTSVPMMTFDEAHRQIFPEFMKIMEATSSADKSYAEKFKDVKPDDVAAMLGGVITQEHGTVDLVPTQKTEDDKEHEWSARGVFHIEPLTYGGVLTRLAGAPALRKKLREVVTSPEAIEFLDEADALSSFKNEAAPHEIKYNQDTKYLTDRGYAAYQYATKKQKDLAKMTSPELESLIKVVDTATASTKVAPNKKMSRFAEEFETVGSNYARFWKEGTSSVHKFQGSGKAYPDYTLEKDRKAAEKRIKDSLGQKYVTEYVMKKEEKK